MKLEQSTPPSTEPISVTELKTHLRVDIADNDTLLAAYLAAARRMVEEYTGRQLVTATWKLYLDDWPSGDVTEFPWNPVIGITSITYTDTAGATQTVAAADYSLDNKNIVAAFRPAYNGSWPSNRGFTNDICVTFVAGHITPFTANAGTNVCTLTGGQVAVDTTKVRLSTSGGALPTGLSAATDYFMRDSTGSTCKLAATSGGAEIDITVAETAPVFMGTLPAGCSGVLPFGCKAAIFMAAADLYERRESMNVLLHGGGSLQNNKLFSLLLGLDSIPRI